MWCVWADKEPAYDPRSVGGDCTAGTPFALTGDSARCCKNIPTLHRLYKVVPRGPAMHRRATTVKKSPQKHNKQ
jgi:hypothetical protein